MNSKRLTIGLNMIVKDEEHIVEETLINLCDKIKFDYWVISDTGSTDKTPEIIINFFKLQNIPGELKHDVWKDFGHNRTLALNHAYNKTDLLLIFDADDVLCGNFNVPEKNEYDEYNIKFVTNNISYNRCILINNREKFKYFGVLHEYISCLKPNSRKTILEGEYYVSSRRLGNRNKDREKYLKDAIILKNAHKEAIQNNDPIYKRYAFYCANSYKDYGNYEEAINWYKITLKQENWNQEMYISCLKIYECYEKLGLKENSFYYLIKSLKYDNKRVECIYHLIVHYCIENMNEVAYNFYLMIQHFFEKDYYNNSSCINNKLFVDVSKHNFYLPYYMIIVTERLKLHEHGIRMYEIIFEKKSNVFDNWWIKNLLHNLQFFLPHVKCSKFKDKAISYLEHLKQNKVDLKQYGVLIDYKKYGIDLDTNKESAIVFTKEECFQSKNILFYTGFAHEKWNYSFMNSKSLGGSEKAVAYLSKTFPSEYTIYVSGDVNNEEFENIKYVHYNELNDLFKEMPFHTIIISRYIGFLEMFENFSFYQLFLWAHDTFLFHYGCNLSQDMILNKWINSINGIICLTEWHADLIKKIYPILKNKINIINNGIDVKLFKKTNIKIKNRFIYSSAPERGLEILINLWSKITESIPDATLVISSCYDFSKKEQNMQLLSKIKEYNNIIFMGKLNSSELYEQMSLAEYWLYPCIFNETSCITAMENLMSEVICLYYPRAGLTNTMQNYGIEIASGNEIEKVINLSEDEKSQLRIKGKEYAETCSWENRYKEWAKVLFNKKCTIILTSTVNVNLKQHYLYQKDANERLQTYLKSILQWLNKTNFNIILVENSGYKFEELEEMQNVHKNRFEIITFKEDELEESAYLINNVSKGASEMFSINYAFRNSKIVKNSNFIIKITARFFIPELEEYLMNYNLDHYDCLTQNNRERCEMVGSHVNNFYNMFNINLLDSNNNRTRHVEDVWKYRTESYKNVLVCKNFEIEETQRGGENTKYTNI